ncbi:MAG: tRNA adenosine(34) deaminase TadA [Gammaproteobacteria bacterium]|nr:tRNA adenosine(34) deaminase TadA [Gammaproteobacteria bacterium]
MGIADLKNDEYWMQQALAAAREAERNDEVPVGAVLVDSNKLISTASNSPISLNDPSAHAEVLAIRKASIALNNYRLPGVTLYVTLEPCMMCAGAMLHARIERLVFGAYDQKTGVAGSCCDWINDEMQVHKIKVQGGILKEECGSLLQNFFKQKRLDAKS